MIKISVLVASVCGAMCALLAGAGFEKYVKYIASLVCICLMLAPLKSIVFGWDDIKENEETGIGTSEAPLLAEQMAEENTEKYICEIVFGKFGIKAVSANIVIDWDQPDAVINEITVEIPKEESGRIGEIKDFLVQTLGGEVKVIEA